MLKKTVATLLICWLATGYSFAQSGPPKVQPTPTPTPSLQTKPVERTAPTLSGVTPSPTPPAPTATPTAEDDGEVIRVETNLITFPVSVLDRDGRFIPGLTKDDFRLFEDGVEQKIQHFQPVETPFTVVMMIDVSPSTRFKIQEIQDAAIAFVDQLRSNDRVMVVSFDEGYKVLCAPTNHRWTLYSAIRQVEFGNGTSLYKAVDRMLSDDLTRIEGRKAVVLFTDGVDTTSRGATYASTVRDAEEADALFFPVRYDTLGDVGGYSRTPTTGRRYPPTAGGGTGAVIGTVIGAILSGILGGTASGVGGNGRPAGIGKSEYETGKRYLEDLARASGGRNFESGADLYVAFAGVAEELRRQYSIGYYPENIGEPGTRKQIRVRVTRPNLIVRAKTTYIVGK